MEKKDLDKLIDINLKKIYESKSQSLVRNELVDENEDYLDYHSVGENIWEEMEYEDLVEDIGFEKKNFKITRNGRKVYKGKLRDKPSYNNGEVSENVTYNDFTGATIGMLNQETDLSNSKFKNEQNNHPEPKAIKEYPIISFISKFWWTFVIPLAVIIIGFMINEKVIDISWLYQ